MDVGIFRFSPGKDDTLGIFSINNKFACFSLEDEPREKKVYGETCIADGTYDLELRTEGGMHERYKKLFPWHEGMLWIRNVPKFTFIYIHIGNDEDDTFGCPVVGDQVKQNITKRGFVGSSRVAYKRIYLQILSAMKKGEKVHITIKTPRL